MESAAIHYKFVKDNVAELKEDLLETIRIQNTEINKKVDDIVSKHLVLAGTIGPGEKFETLIDYAAGKNIPKLTDGLGKLSYELSKVKT